MDGGFLFGLSGLVSFLTLLFYVVAGVWLVNRLIRNVRQVSCLAPNAEGYSADLAAVNASLALVRLIGFTVLFLTAINVLLSVINFSASACTMLPSINGQATQAMLLVNAIHAAYWIAMGASEFTFAMFQIALVDYLLKRKELKRQTL